MHSSIIMSFCLFFFSFLIVCLLSFSENSSTDQKQACKKHELYVSFRDLGWQVRTAFLSQLAQQEPNPNTPGCWSCPKIFINDTPESAHVIL